MRQEDKEILLKDLCARLPYGIKFKADNEEYIREIHYIKDEDVYIKEYRNLSYWIDAVKPYLRPMSSMTEEEKEDFEFIREWNGELNGIGGYYVEVDDTSKYIDYLNSHHFDYRGLIEKGLALEAPEEMYNIKD